MTDLGISGIGDAQLIASGGSALVYQAIDDGGRAVAVKVLRGVRGAEVARRFDREQKAAERLQEHPHIIDVFRTGVSGAGEPFLIMPLMARGSLADEVEANGAFSHEQAVADVATAAEAIDFAHRRGVLHRDLKPGNLLRSDDGSIMVTDFGIARVLDAGITSATIGATTPLYAAPELLEENEASVQSDVYALGALLYTLLAGSAAFSDSQNIWASISRIRSEEAPSIPGVPAPLMRVVEQAMAKEPMGRPPTADQFRRNLLASVDAGPNWRPPSPAELTVQAPPPGPAIVPAVPTETVEIARPGPESSTAFDVPAAPSPTGVPDRAQPFDAPEQISSNTAPRRGLAIGAGVLVLLAGLAWFGLTRGDTETAEPAPPIDTSLPPLSTPTPVPAGSDEATTDADTNVDDAAPDPDEDPAEDPAEEPTPTDRLVSFNGSYFSAYFPEGWSVARQDIDVGYGFRSEFVADDMYLNVDTTPAELRSGNGTVAASAREIAATISTASAVRTEEIDGLTLHSFTFRNNRGVESIDIFFEVDGDGYAIVAGSNNQPDDAFAIARQVALTVRSSA